MVSLMVQNVTLASPLAEAFQLVEFLVGPLGSIDMKAIPCPASVKQLVASGLDVLRTSLVSTPEASTAYSNLSANSFDNLTPIPKAFASQAGWYEYGGNILCDGFGGYNFSKGWMMLTSRVYPCDQAVTALLRPTKDVVLLAGIATGFPQAIDATTSVADACRYLFPQGDDVRDAYFLDAAMFLQTYIRPHDKVFLASLAAVAFDDASAAQASMMQYINRVPTLPLLRVHYHVLNATEPGFLFWGWMFILEWALGNREVVSFQGDAGSIHLVTEFAQTTAADVQPRDLPTVLAVYMRVMLLYVTSAMLAIAVLVVVYVFSCRGFVEGSNLSTLNRVAGIVWVGRPLLLLRSLTALCLLSTATLELTFRSPGVSLFQVPQVPWYKTVLSAGEATWLVYIVNDICLVWTKQYTKMYASCSSLLVWVLVAILTVVWPVEHCAMMTASTSCEIDHMDFQLVCHSGAIVIGTATRLHLLLGLVCSSNVVCYVASRWYVDPGRLHPAKLTYHPSLLLSAGSQYFYDAKLWAHKGLYHLDPASALMNGLVTLRWRHSVYVVDVKIWRSFAIPLDDSIYLPKHLTMAVPLVE
ncbi:Aste57867_18139 [Aphanomyces stellatus]|uniref:Aste57867_18139 protein n=1 Tax=Aphanomyces stellatus TaxID=120398 RepID=A0A485LB08_9STRA|nr:hypothetical protein As57867_018077 [Aphanomyces stellatus]VFT94877.1 Aste57867_18139 [Aphanomyces stellatus]